MICGDCKRALSDDQFLTEVNPEGGYGRPQLLVCDDCMNSGRWDWWLEEHWQRRDPMTGHWDIQTLTLKD